jgi:hypothetical protein
MMSAMMAAGQLELLQERLAICCQGASQGCRQLLRDLLGHYAPGSARRANVNVVFSDDCTEADEVYIICIYYIIIIDNYNTILIYSYSNWPY